MQRVAITFVDGGTNVVARGDVAEVDDRFSGVVDLRPMPEAMRSTFQEFEEIVNSQVFSVLDEIEDRIAGLGIKVVFGDGPAVPVENLQVYPSRGTISFKLCKGARCRATPA